MTADGNATGSETETAAGEATESTADDEAGEASAPEPIVSPPDTDGEDEGEQFTATVRSVERVPATEIPTDYPVSIATAEAVAVHLTIEGTEEPVFVLYFETPERGPDDRLARLLALVGNPTDDERELEGESLLLTIADGHYMPVVPEGKPRGNAKAVYGIFAGLIPSLVIGLVGIFSPGASFIASTPFVAGWLVATFLLLPVSLYIDALSLRTTTNWTGSPRKWAVMAAVPGLNVAAVPLYLIARENANKLL